MGKGGRLETLDGMRGLCALIVAVGHYNTFLGAKVLFPLYGLCVEIFFVISGFVIAKVYEDRLASGFTTRQFLAKRLIRLTPTEWMGTAVGTFAAILLILAGKQVVVPGFTWSIFAGGVLLCLILIPPVLTPLNIYFRDWGAVFPMNAPLWSLQGEWFINILYARYLHRLSTPLLGALAVLSAGILIWLDNQTAMFPSVCSGLGRASVGFLAGVVLYRWHRATGLKGFPTARPELVYAVWALIAFMPEAGYEPIREIITDIGGLFLVGMLVRSDRPMARPWLFLGEMSYPLYACHFGVMMLWELYLPTTRPNSVLWLFPYLATAYATAFAISIMSRRVSDRLQAFRTPAVQPSL